MSSLSRNPRALSARTLALLALLCVCAGGPSQAAPASVVPGGVAYVRYTWPTRPVTWNGTEEGFFTLDHFVNIQGDPGDDTAYYFAHQFLFYQGDTGYFGLQTNGHIDGQGWVGNMVLFAIWSALDAIPGDGVTCAPFDNEGSGWTCKMPYDWLEGRTYRLRLWELCCAGTGDDEWWGAWIQDTVTGEELFLGQIKVPGAWKWLDGWSSAWVEYFGTIQSCDALPTGQVTYYQPLMDGGRWTPSSVATSDGQICTNVSFQQEGDDVTVDLGTTSGGCSGTTRSLVEPLRGGAGALLVAVPFLTWLRRRSRQGRQRNPQA